MEFFLLQYLPYVTSDQLIDIGLVILREGRAECLFAADWDRVVMLDPHADVEYLNALRNDVQKKLAEDNFTEFIEKMEDSFSNTIQCSPRKPLDPAYTLETLRSLYLL